jgi:hypothetical protein
MTDFIERARPLTRAGQGAVLEVLGLSSGDAAYLWTVIEVETAGVTQGYGFRADRRPQMLFERHKFREFTGGHFDAEAPGISGPPGAYGSTASQYDRLDRALALCEREGLGAEPALRSASWGLGQIMGFNHRAAGFDSASSMVDAMVTGEDAQLRGMAGFLEANRMTPLLRQQDWAGFARRYNGPGYWRNRYDVKLAEQYTRFSSGSLPSLEMRTVQAGLLLLGYAPGRIDGILGRRTREALNAFRLSHGLPRSNDVDAATYDALERAAGFVD